MKKILVTNDDGVQSDGMHALADALARLGEVTVVAPHLEASAIGHALTLRRPLRLDKLREGVYEVDGTPTDCVNIALTQLYANNPPDLVVSGINRGYNLGDDVTYSGTVSGALEGCLLGIPSIAVSLWRGRGPEPAFDHAAAAAATIAELVFEHGLPARTFLNLNVPNGVPRGFRVTIQAKRNHVTMVAERLDPRGKAYYWIEEGQDEWESDPRSDHHAVQNGFVSITPLQPDMTAYEALEHAEKLSGLAGSRSRPAMR
jgi:5'-nucleotidase